MALRVRENSIGSEGVREGTGKVLWAVSVPAAKGHPFLLRFLILNNKNGFY